MEVNTIMKIENSGIMIGKGTQKGAALIVGLLLITVLTIVAVSAAKGNVGQQRMANNYRFSIEAMNNAEIGFMSMLSAINDQELSKNGFDDELDPNGDGDLSDRFSVNGADDDRNIFFNVVMVDDDDGDGDPSSDSNGIVRLMSQGMSNVGSTRTVDVRIAAAVAVSDPISLESAILTEGSLSISGNPEQFGANQDIHSNGDVDISGNPVTGGNVSAGGSVTGTPEGGGTTESGAAYVEIPHIEPGLYAEYADYIFHSDGDIYDADGSFVVNADGVPWNGWKFDGSKWTTDGPDVLGGMLYFTGEKGDVVVGSNPGTEDDPWEISILADGYIEISGNPTLTNYINPDDPPEIQSIMLMSGSDIKINGNPNQSYNGIVAAAEQIDVSGNPLVEGALIAGDQSNESDLVEENSLSGNMMLTYNGGLMFPWVPGGGDGTAIVLSWRDRQIARGTDVFAPVAHDSYGNTTQ